MTIFAPLITLFVSTLLASASVQPLADPEAQELFDRGLSRYSAEEYADASADFRAAYALDPSPEVLYAWAQSERMLGRCSRSSKLYARFLKSDPSEQQAEAARQGIERCEEQADTAPDDLADDIGEEGPVEGPVEDEPAEEDALEPEAEPEPKASPRARPDGLGIGLVSVGVALGASGGGLLAVSERNARRLEDATSYGEYADGVDEVRIFRITGSALAGVGGALLISGIVKLALHRRKRSHNLGFWTDPRGAGVIVQLRY